MNRKKKLRLYQFFFFISGLIIILFTYLKTIENKQDKIISKNTKQKIEKQLKNQNKENSNTFYNIKYSGIDLEGNRYNIESKEGSTSDQNVNIVKMKGVYATFYFKDNTVLRISSDLGDYNNKTLDIIFRKNDLTRHLMTQNKSIGYHGFASFQKGSETFHGSCSRAADFVD